MEGRPVWLASVSYRPDHRPKATGRWPQRILDRATRMTEEMLEGVGDESREVLFRMNVTLCRHRGLTDDEEAALPASFHDFCPTDTAGTAVELLWRRGVTSMAVEPCENPGRDPLPGNPDPDLWIPRACGRCPTCRARESAAKAA
jgi:hypothetical protein